jgi:hypothetical protein
MEAAANIARKHNRLAATFASGAPGSALQLPNTAGRIFAFQKLAHAHVAAMNASGPTTANAQLPQRIVARQIREPHSVAENRRIAPRISAAHGYEPRARVPAAPTVFRPTNDMREASRTRPHLTQARHDSLSTREYSTRVAVNLYARRTSAVFSLTSPCLTRGTESRGNVWPRRQVLGCPHLRGIPPCQTERSRRSAR